MSATRMPTPFDLSPLARVATGDRLCLFLDVDGTLLEIGPTPQSVSVDEPLRDLLLQVSAALDGAVALVSGRPLASLDDLFGLTSWPAAGLHGGERRDAAGRVHLCDADRGRLEPVRDALRRLITETPGALLEEKSHGLALHYRAVPEFEWRLRRIVRQCAVPLAPEYHVLDGKCVIEIKPAAASKAQAIRAFLRERPFAGRTPIFIGDDTTDIDALGCVEDAGGVSVAVGEELPAQLHLASPREVRALLGHLATGSR